MPSKIIIMLLHGGTWGVLTAPHDSLQGAHSTILYSVQGTAMNYPPAPGGGKVYPRLDLKGDNAKSFF